MKIKLLYVLIVIVSLVFTNCSSDSDNENSDKTGQLTVRLTDAPFPYGLVEEANVTVFKVDARRVSENEMEEGNGFVVLMEEEIDINLLDLTNGTTEQLADLDLPTGSYDLVRVYVKGINVVLTDERVFDLKVPSGEQTGIKVFIKPELTIAGGLSSDLLLDFDVSRSFVAKGNMKKVDGITGFNFKPVIKASNMSTAGTLTGQVTTVQSDMDVALEGSQISVFAADTLNTTAFTDIDGNYTVMGLEEGSYAVMAELEGYISSDTIEVQITAANKTIQNFVLEEDASSE